MFNLPMWGLVISFILICYYLYCIKMLSCSHHHNYSAVDDICVLCPFLGGKIISCLMLSLYWIMNFKL